VSTNTLPPPETASFAPLADWHEQDQHSHVVQFYADDTFLIDGLSRFLGTALGGGDAAIIIATKAHRDALFERLKARGFDVPRAIEQGRYLPLDAAETLSKFMRKGLPDARRFADVIGDAFAQARAAAEGDHPRVVAFGEMVSLLWDQERPEAALLLEHLWNDFARIHSFSLRCAYPIRSFNRHEHADLFLKICQEHAAVVPGESYTALENNDDRLRQISLLQQKAEALETEKAEHKRVERALRENEARLQQAKAELESVVQQRTAALRRLSAQVMNLQDSERRRIARELHDSLGQYLAGLKLSINLLKHVPLNARLWTEAEELLEQCIADVRTLSYLLHPPMMDEAGLASAAQWYVEGFGQRSGLKVSLETADDLERLPDVVELVLFRGLQEALTNVHRHSGASAVEVRILRDAEQVMLEVKDDGHGIARELLASLNDGGSGAGVGLASMRERVRELGGELRLQSDPLGSLLRITIPIAVPATDLVSTNEYQ
jgi:signal transduction histidine kinase